MNPSLTLPKRGCVQYKGGLGKTKLKGVQGYHPTWTTDVDRRKPLLKSRRIIDLRQVDVRGGSPTTTITPNYTRLNHPQGPSGGSGKGRSIAVPDPECNGGTTKTCRPSTNDGSTGKLKYNSRGKVKEKRIFMSPKVFSVKSRTTNLSRD